MIGNEDPLKNAQEAPRESSESFEGGNESPEELVETESDLEGFSRETIKDAKKELSGLSADGRRGVDGANGSIGLAPEKVAKFQEGADKSIGEIAASGEVALDDLIKEMEGILGGNFKGTREEKRKRMAEIGEEAERIAQKQETDFAKQEAAFQEEMGAREAAHRERTEALRTEDKDSIAEAEKKAQEIVDNDPGVQALKAELARIKASDEAAEAAHQAEMEKMRQQADEMIASLRKGSEVSKASVDAAGPGSDKESQIAEILKAKMAERAGETPKTTQQEMIDRMLGKNKTEQSASKPTGDPETDTRMADFEANLAEQKAKDKERMAAHEANIDAMAEKTNELSRLSQELEANSAALDDAMRKNQEAAREASSPTTEVERSCQKCGGKTSNNGSAFCSECGNKLEQITPEMVQKQYQKNISRLQQSYEEVLRAQKNYDQSSQNFREMLKKQTKRKAA